MKTIIIPTDFSPASVNAMNYGLDMAKAIDASVLLLHVYNVPVSVSEVPVLLISVDDLRNDADARVQELKKKAEHITSGKVKIYAETRMGNVLDELEDVCNAVHPFTIVMGSRGTTGLERAVFGSTTLAAIRHLKVPVIAVPPGKEFGAGIKKIGFACDFQNVVETTPGAVIKNIVHQFNAVLHVLNVDHKEKHFKPETPEQSALLHTMIEELNPVYDFIDSADIEEGINNFAEKNNLDLIIAIPKKHKLLQGLFKTSSTKQLVFQSHIPVMCIHE